MKRILIAVAAAFAVSASFADDRCKTVGDLAESTMKARQSGVAISTIMALPSNTKLTRAIAIDAYKQPRFEVEENRVKAVQNFRVVWEVACYEATSKGESV